MQSQESNTGTAGALSHPEAGEWMSYLYRELAPERARELEAHLTVCAACKTRVEGWCSSTVALDEWKLPRMKRQPKQWSPAFKWAAAAAVVLLLGFAIGRQSSSSAREIAALKASVAQLDDSMRRENVAAFSNGLASATAAAHVEMVHLLSDFAEVQQAQRANDQQILAATLENFDTRLTRMRTELETVAVNTATGFEQTHDNLTRLASLASVGSRETSTNPY